MSTGEFRHYFQVLHGDGYAVIPAADAPGARVLVDR
jgi:hypothetical protein